MNPHQKKEKSNAVRLTIKARDIVQHIHEKYGVEKQRIIEEAITRLSEKVDKCGISALYDESAKRQDPEDAPPGHQRSPPSVIARVGGGSVFSVKK